MIELDFRAITCDEIEAVLAIVAWGLSHGKDADRVWQPGYMVVAAND